MKEKQGQFGSPPVKRKPQSEPLSISGFIKNDGILTGYVLSNGLTITIDERLRMEKTGALE